MKYIFLNGIRVARIDPNGTAKFYVADMLGTTALVTDAAGNVLNDSLFFPYGVERVITQNDAGNNYKFTGKERDAETELDDFGARYYESSLGRFMTPDWDAKPTAVPYASYGDPQTLNLYSYVENGPLNRVDADGHAPTRYLSTDTTDSESGPYGCDAASPVTGGCSTSQVEVDAGMENAKIEALGGQANTGKPRVETSQQQSGTTQNTDSAPQAVTNAPAQDNMVFAKGGGGQRKGERNHAAKPDGTPDPGKHTRPDPNKPGNILVKDPHTGKTVSKPNPNPTLMDRMKSVTPGPIVKMGTAGIIIYVIIDEGSRLYPPRNLVPVP